MSREGARVGVRELRQNLSVYLRRVRAGESFEVTERGHPVALLRPLPPEEGPLARLIASGTARAAEGDLRDLPAPGGPVSTWASEALMDDRRSQRF